MSVTRALQSAIDAILLAGQGQQHWLDRNPHPPLDASLTEAMAFYGGPRAALSLWMMCKAVRDLHVALAVQRATEAADALVSSETV